MLDLSRFRRSVHPEMVAGCRPKFRPKFRPMISTKPKKRILTAWQTVMIRTIHGCDRPTGKLVLRSARLSGWVPLGSLLPVPCTSRSLNVKFYPAGGRCDDPALRKRFGLPGEISRSRTCTLGPRREARAARYPVVP